MGIAATNTLWARSFADELARCGVREVALAPGSRSTPLVLALAADGRFRLRVHLDERSAAFFALGVGKASRVPGAVVTTSGTATANVFPAVIEASASEAPLLVLTADRPPRLRDADANQAMDQVRLYGIYPRLFVDVPEPSASAAALAHLRALAARAVATALGPSPGPVHLNFPFEKPLEPDATSEGPPSASSAGRDDDAPYVRISSGLAVLGEEQLVELANMLRSPRGVIVTGPTPEPGAVGAAAVRLAERTGFPLLADPLSGARFRPGCGAQRVAAYDLFLSDDRVARALDPSLVIRVGSAPTSAAVQAWLGRHDGVTHVVVDAGSRWKDHAATATHYVRADPAATLTALAQRADRAAEEAWRERWHAASRAALSLLDDSGPAHEGDVLAAVARAIPEGGTLFVSSSMPVRDLDGFAAPSEKALHVLGNRGVSGIDGIVSTAFGVASQRGAPTVCALGDIAFFHDQNGLLWSREDDAPVVFVLIDNDGGAIFHQLPVAGHEPHFTEYFVTPHGLDFAHAAALHGVPFTDAEPDGLEGALTKAIAAGGTAIVRVRTNRHENHARHVDRRAAVVAAVREALHATSTLSDREEAPGDSPRESPRESDER
jgi:2-succinyl-5-enolpyruvyl-6-hydroxy-3-cyclohexene-1-carboxylate synthase